MNSLSAINTAPTALSLQSRDRSQVTGEITVSELGTETLDHKSGVAAAHCTVFMNYSQSFAP